MENKINIVELLKDCPSGMELDCTMYENVYFDKIYDEYCLYQIGCYTINDGVRNSINFTKYGEFNTMRIAKCVIFPKGKTTWGGFVPPCKFKDGDIVYTCNDDKDEYIFIFESITENTHVNSYLHIKDGYDLRISKVWLTNCDDKYLRLATKEEKEKLFKAIKDNGYRWNPETKTLEKLIEPKFKVGDVIQDIDTYKVKITEVNIEDECYGYESMIAKGIGSISFNEQDNWELVPSKFDINTLKPFESKVLVRDYDDRMWNPAFWGKYLEDSKYSYLTSGGCYKQCIPYEGNEYLLGTNNDCDNFYKTW